MTALHPLAPELRRAVGSALVVALLLSVLGAFIAAYLVYVGDSESAGPLLTYLVIVLVVAQGLSTAGMLAVVRWLFRMDRP